MTRVKAAGVQATVTQAHAIRAISTQLFVRYVKCTRRGNSEASTASEWSVLSKPADATIIQKYVSWRSIHMADVGSYPSTHGVIFHCQLICICGTQSPALLTISSATSKKASVSVSDILSQKERKKEKRKKVKKVKKKKKVKLISNLPIYRTFSNSISKFLTDKYAISLTVNLFNSISPYLNGD
jgi:hypothetical protein